MARKNQLDLSLPQIELYFNNSSKRSFTEKKFSDIFYHNRHNWKIPASSYAMQVLNYLVKKKKFNKKIFTDSSGYKKIIYSWGTQDEFTVISGLKHESYYSYYTALFLHQLTLQIPKTIYINFEHSLPSRNDSLKTELTQNGIDKAFKKPQRKSSASYTFGNKKIIITNGKHTGKLGVKEYTADNESYMFTDMERTLIDISVRPVYAGGIFEVIEAFKIARGKLDVIKLESYLNKLDYIYPYHQIIGFYLEKANYNKNDIEIFRKEMKFDFYLTYDIRNKEYSKDWKLYYPKGV